MAGEIGISVWLAMTDKQQKQHLQLVEENHIQQIRSLTYEKAIELTHELLQMVNLLPFNQHKRHLPQGIGVTLGKQKI